MFLSSLLVKSILALSAMGTKDPKQEAALLLGLFVLNMEVTKGFLFLVPSFR